LGLRTFPDISLLERNSKRDSPWSFSPLDDKRLVPMPMMVLLRCSVALSLMPSVCDCVMSMHSPASSSLRTAIVGRLG
jgi:hypothetical protein